MATTMGYRPSGLMICTNPKAVLRNSNSGGLRISTFTKPPVVPPRRHPNQRIWDRLPVEVLLEIRKYLSPLDLIRFGMTCRSAGRAVKTINPLIMVRRRHFNFLIKHLSDFARVHDGRAAFLTDADDLFDEMTGSLRCCYGDTTSHRNGFYSDFECDFVLSALSKEDRSTRDMFVSDMLSVYGQTTHRCFWEEEREGPPITAEEESFRVNRPRNGRWFKVSAQTLVEKKSSVFSRIKKKFGIPSNQLKSMSPIISSPSSSPRLSLRTSISSPTCVEFDEDDVKSVILRWARDKVTGVYIMSFVKVYGSGWAFEWFLGSRLGEC